MVWRGAGEADHRQPQVRDHEGLFPRSGCPARLRRICRRLRLQDRCLADANGQLREWILGKAGNRIHGSTREQPLGLFAMEKPALGPLPDQPPEAAAWAKVKVHRDGHVHYDKCLYSVPYRFAGQFLWLKAAPLTVWIYVSGCSVTSLLC